MDGGGRTEYVGFVNPIRVVLVQWSAGMAGLG